MPRAIDVMANPPPIGLMSPNLVTQKMVEAPITNPMGKGTSPRKNKILRLGLNNAMKS
jgi:hypothetical protein